MTYKSAADCVAAIVIVSFENGNGWRIAVVWPFIVALSCSADLMNAGNQLVVEKGEGSTGLFHPLGQFSHSEAP